MRLASFVLYAAGCFESKSVFMISPMLSQIETESGSDS